MARVRLARVKKPPDRRRSRPKHHPANYRSRSVGRMIPQVGKVTAALTLVACSPSAFADLLCGLLRSLGGVTPDQILPK